MAGAVFKHGILLSLIALLACANPRSPLGAPDQFTIVTADGTVLASIEGGAAGVPGDELLRLIRSGVAQSYPIACTPASEADPVQQLTWHVTSLGPRPQAILSVHLLQDGREVGSNFARIAAPGTGPDAIFVYDVARLARRVLPPPPEGSSPQPTGCS